MREIEFRAYCPETNYMAYQGTPDLETIQSFMFHWGDKLLMQYTGFKDRNGKKIYEGDIVEYINHNTTPFSQRKAVVSFLKIDNQNFGNILFPFCDAVEGKYKENNRQLVNIFCTPSDETEIIGNIFENPELLNE